MHTTLQLIWQSSYSSVSLDDICNQARVNKGSFYVAYKSKSNLAAAAFERAWKARQAKVEECFDKKLPPLTRLERYCDQIRANQLERYQALGKMLGCPFCSIGCELSTIDEDIRQKAEQIGARNISYLQEALSELIAEKTIRFTDPMELAYEIYSYVIGVVLQAKIENSPSHLDRLKPGMWRLLDIESELTAA